ncbi:hypothetical protein [Aquella oligotrophica]|uniref:Uncharacterized protein n=1 Tax=Aquella oligotrophica TaxID=2067065 RepID=A0A2I7N6F3_9NEIS|nr:hypothetical protein [Aquella oligotrophica]AUR52057.1 hypothetical protein CUN60_07005 [Aquella oligotrophica]
MDKDYLISVKQAILHPLSVIGGCEIYQYLGKDGAPCAFLSRGKSKKVSWHLKFSSLEALNDKVSKQINSYLDIQESKTKYKQEKTQRSKVAATLVNIGDIFYYSWGYDCTITSFWQVIAKSGMTVKLQQIDYRIDHIESGRNEYLLPLKDQFVNDEVITKRIRSYCQNHSPAISMDHGLMVLHGGKPVYQTNVYWR